MAAQISCFWFTPKPVLHVPCPDFWPSYSRQRRLGSGPFDSGRNPTPAVLASLPRPDRAPVPRLRQGEGPFDPPPITAKNRPPGKWAAPRFPRLLYRIVALARAIVIPGPVQGFRPAFHPAGSAKVPWRPSTHIRSSSRFISVQEAQPAPCHFARAGGPDIIRLVRSSPQRYASGEISGYKQRLSEGTTHGRTGRCRRGAATPGRSAGPGRSGAGEARRSAGRA
jgi:hypothetical protein